MPMASSWSCADRRLAAAGVLPGAVRGRPRLGGGGRQWEAGASVRPSCWPGRKVAEIGGYPATFHIREFLDCVKSRANPRANADVARQSHIACHAANIALFLDRKLKYDPVKNEFIDDDAANRLRSEALREPWRT